MLDDKPTQDDQQSKLVKESATVTRNLDEAIQRLAPGEPLILNEGMLVNDGGILILSQYIDVGTQKLRHRPEVIVKFIESKYGLEHASQIQLSAPSRFREYGETLIQDDQEGRARRETKTESPTRSSEEYNREQERALSLLGQKGISINTTRSPTVHVDAQNLRYGESSWIYCTSIVGFHGEPITHRPELPNKYDHETVIRQPGKFALGLGDMYVNQEGPQPKKGHFTHGGVKSLHSGLLVFHGPVWYTDDVFGFLQSQQSHVTRAICPFFVKHSDYRDQREYRFVVHCEDSLEAETLHLQISGAMRDALAPPGFLSRVTFEPLEGADDEASPLKASPLSSTHKTMIQTKTTSRRQGQKIRIGGEDTHEEIITSEQTITLTTRLPAEGAGSIVSDPEDPTSGEGELIETETRERRVKGSTTDKTTNWRTRVFTIADTSGAGKLFSLEERDHAEELLEAAGRPFVTPSALPRQATEVLKELARQASHVKPEVEVQIMSACWNSIWAICNLQETFGDIVASAGIVHDEFVAITLTGSADACAEGKILVGPRGTFAYLLTRGDEQHPGHGGAASRLFFFPDEKARAAFEEYGWHPMKEDHNAIEEED